MFWQSSRDRDVRGLTPLWISPRQNSTHPYSYFTFLVFLHIVPSVRFYVSLLHFISPPSCCKFLSFSFCPFSSSLSSSESPLSHEDPVYGLRLNVSADRNWPIGKRGWTTPLLVPPMPLPSPTSDDTHAHTSLPRGTRQQSIYMHFLWQDRSLVPHFTFPCSIKKCVSSFQSHLSLF